MRWCIIKPIDYRFQLMRENRFNCFICGKSATDIHHIFNGADKLKSEKYNAMIPVCRNCHNEIHDNPQIKTTLKSLFQDKVMIDNEMSMEEWMEEFGKNYMEVNE